MSHSSPCFRFKGRMKSVTHVTTFLVALVWTFENFALKMVIPYVWWPSCPTSRRPAVFENVSGDHKKKKRKKRVCLVLSTEPQRQLTKWRLSGVNFASIELIYRDSDMHASHATSTHTHTRFHKKKNIINYVNQAPCCTLQRQDNKCYQYQLCWWH